ncbi:MAG: extracellular metalloprotease M10 family [Parcubacteria bacterium C7867-004]|nr:MAG: extracellular metalloprotease M10 family [Parcubacteria bacterium C7867-004]
MASFSHNTRESVVSLIVLVVVGAGSYAYYSTVIHPQPCTSVKTYTIGTFDAKFGLSKADFMDAINDAAAVWNTAAGKSVLAYDEQGTIPVSLAYDERQQSVELRESIDAEQETYESKAARVDARKKELDKDREAYEVLKASIEARSKNANTLTPDERAELNADIRLLNTMVGRLNNNSAELNVQIKALNALAANTNEKVSAYNSVNAGTDFDQGRYVRDGEGERITIYEFESKNELTRALAHEFGHALGLDHNEDPASIMYPYNKAGSLTLSENDWNAFMAICKLK